MDLYVMLTSNVILCFTVSQFYIVSPLFFATAIASFCFYLTCAFFLLSIWDVYMHLSKLNGCFHTHSNVFRV